MIQRTNESYWQKEQTDSGFEEVAHVGTGINVTGSGHVRAITEDSDVGSDAALIDIGDLYPTLSGSRTPLGASVTLLADVHSLLSQAVEANKDEELFHADDYVVRVQSLIPELFMHRSIGDGFAVIVNSIRVSLENREGVPLNDRQLLALRNAVYELRNEPRLDAERAVDIVMKLDSEGLDTDPPELAHLAELLDNVDLST